MANKNERTTLSLMTEHSLRSLTRSSSSRTNKEHERIVKSRIILEMESLFEQREGKKGVDNEDDHWIQIMWFLGQIIVNNEWMATGHSIWPEEERIIISTVYC